jgi:hypothetical protein
MILNDTYRFVFVHIPKCAGSTVRQFFQQFDEADGFFSKRVAKHPALGTIDYTHIPLFILKEHFPEVYAKVSTYSSYAVVRDPLERFPSSFTQHLKMYGSQKIHKMGLSEIKQEIARVISFLEKHDGVDAYLPLEYIHFQRQADYIYFQGKRIVKSIYNIENLNDMYSDISQTIKQPLQSELASKEGKANQSFVYRSEASRILVERLRPFIKTFIPEIFLDKIRMPIRKRLYVPRQRRLAEIFCSEYIIDFIQNYYKNDFEIAADVPHLSGARAK